MTSMDAEVVAEVLAGRTDRFALLVQRHQAALFRQARAMGLEPDVAADMVQEAFIRAWEGLGGCEDPARFRLWVGRILRNRCLDHLKRASTRKTVPMATAVEAPGRAGMPGGGPLDDLDTPATVHERGLLGTAIDEALAGLSPEAREAFVLKHVEGQSYEDMTRVTGASVSALKMRVHRAREFLRDALDVLVTEEM